MKRLFHRPQFTVLAILGLAAIFAPFIAPHNPMDPVTTPGILGTDTLNRDLFSRLIYGNRTSILIAFSGSLGAMFVGTIFGGLLALGPRPLRHLLRIFLQTLLSMPMIIFFFLGIALVDDSGPVTLILIFSYTLWPESARLIEARIKELQEAEFVQVARMGGLSGPRLFIREILPNLYQIWTISFLVTFITAALLESALGFLGLGQDLGQPSLGHLIEYGTHNADTHPHILFLSLGLLLTWIFSLRALLRKQDTHYQKKQLIAIEPTVRDAN